MAITIRLFGQLTEMAGGTTLQVADVPDTDALRQQLEAKWPRLRELPYLVAVDKNIAQQNTTILPGAEIALLPPYSGG